MSRAAAGIRKKYTERKINLIEEKKGVRPRIIRTHLASLLLFRKKKNYSLVFFFFFFFSQTQKLSARVRFKC